jgi:phage-related holin
MKDFTEQIDKILSDEGSQVIADTPTFYIDEEDADMTSNQQQLGKRIQTTI